VCRRLHQQHKCESKNQVDLKSTTQWNEPLKDETDLIFKRVRHCLGAPYTGGPCCYPPSVSSTAHGHWKWSVLRLVGFGLDCNGVWLGILLANHFFSGKLSCMKYEWLEQLRRSLCSTESDSEHSSHEWNSVSFKMAWPGLWIWV